MADVRYDDDYEDDEDFEDELDAAEVVDEFMTHPKVKKTFALFTETLDRFGQLIDQVSRHVPGVAPPREPSRARFEGSHRGPVPPQANARKAIDPFLVMGFQPGQPLTAEMIKNRRKQLATIYHPDKGGDPEAMRMVNAATDMLLKKVQ